MLQKFINFKQILSIYFTVAIPLLYLFNLQIVFQYHQTFFSPMSVVILGIALAMVGCVLWIMSYVNLGRSFGVLPQKQKTVKRGLYRYTAHPMYIAIWLTFLGLSLANQSWQGLFFLNVILLPVLFVRARLEEKDLLK